MLLTIKQFSTQYQIPLDTCYKHIHRGILQAEKIGSTYLIDDDSLSVYSLKLKELADKQKVDGGKITKFPVKTGKVG